MPITLLQSQAMVILRHLSTRRLHLSIHSSKFRGSPSLSTPLLPSKLQSFPRYASSSQQITAESRSLVTRLQNLLLGTAIGVSLALGYYYVTDTRAGIHQWVVVPSLRWMYDDAEDAHEAGTKALKALYEFGIHPRERGASEKTGDLEVEVFGHTISNPIGTSAGIDKHAEIPTPLLALGPAVIEIGGATPYPQDGNPRPRVFRLPSQKALINRYGLNSEGADIVAMRLRQRVREFAYSMGFGIDENAEQKVLDGEAGVPPGSLVVGKLMAVQVAKNKFTPDDDIEAVKRDYVYCVEALARYADVIVVNVSSPNTPGLRGLQKVEPLTNILTGVVGAAKNTRRKTKPAVMVKVSPDEDSEEEVAGICDAVWQSGVDGVIVGNTTKRRPDPLPAGYRMPDKEAAALLEQGGYSGPQLFDRTVSLVKRYRRTLDEGGRQKSQPALDASYSSDDEPPKPTGGPPSGDNPENTLIERIEATVKRDKANLKKPSEEGETSSSSQPLIRLPARNNPFSSKSDVTDSSQALSASTHLDQLPLISDEDASFPLKASRKLEDSKPSSSSSSSPSSTPQKVIFATGGITNGKQALEVLNAGASVAQIYTAMIFGGVGTVSRIKKEMREEMKKDGKRRP